MLFIVSICCFIFHLVDIICTRVWCMTVCIKLHNLAAELPETEREREVLLLHSYQVNAPCVCWLQSPSPSLAQVASVSLWQWSLQSRLGENFANPKIQSLPDSNLDGLYKFVVLSETRYVRDDTQISPKTKLVEAPQTNINTHLHIIIQSIGQWLNFRIYQIFTQPTAELSATALPSCFPRLNCNFCLDDHQTQVFLYSVAFTMLFSYRHTFGKTAHSRKGKLYNIYWFLWVWLTNWIQNLVTPKSNNNEMIVKFHKQDILGTSWCISEHQELAGWSGRVGGAGD